MSEQLLSLPVIEELSAHVSRRQVGELPVIVVDHPRVRAAVALQGAHLISWQPAGEQPVLWLSEATAFTQGKAIRGGVPVCWPWFGPAGEPAHGFARISTWALSTCDEDAEQVRLEFVLRSDERTMAIWPHGFELRIRFELGRTCSITLEARGDYQSTGALHSYFNVGDVAGVSVSGLGAPYLDHVTGENGRRPGGVQDFPGRIDRAFTDPAEISRIEDPALERTIEIRHHNHSDVVVWNPGPELSRTMADLTDAGYREFVCVETASIDEPMISTEAAPAVLSTTISVVAGASGGTRG